jgi:hypothetical protein
MAGNLFAIVVINVVLYFNLAAIVKPFVVVSAPFHAAAKIKMIAFSNQQKRRL